MHNIFREALLLLQLPPEVLTEADRSTINAASIPLDHLKQFDNLTTEQGLEILADLVDSA